MQHLWDDEFHYFRRERWRPLGYSDGAEVEERLYRVIRDAKDRSTFSRELAPAITDWPSEYHLSRGRHCLLRPLGIKPGDTVLELGAGCGAITRYLGEIGALVVAVEGSLLRARGVTDKFATAHEKCGTEAAILGKPRKKLVFSPETEANHEACGLLKLRIKNQANTRSGVIR